MLRTSLVYFLVIFTFLVGKVRAEGDETSNFFLFPKNEDRYHASYNKVGINFKAHSSLFNLTFGLESEYILSSRYTVGLILLAKMGDQQSDRNQNRIRQEDYLERGYLAEAYVRHYIKFKSNKRLKAPTGVYVQASLGYNSIIYFDGNTRPLTLHNRWKDLNETNNASLERPLPFIGGLGAGYQVLLIPKRIIGNLRVGVQGNVDSESQLFMSLYIALQLVYRFNEITFL